MMESETGDRREIGREHGRLAQDLAASSSLSSRLPKA